MPVVFHFVDEIYMVSSSSSFNIRERSSSRKPFMCTYVSDAISFKVTDFFWEQPRQMHTYYTK